MKKFIISFCTFVTLFCLLFTFSCCADKKSKTEEIIEPSELVVEDEKIECGFIESTGFWYVKVTGSIKNTTGKNLSKISVKYEVSTESGYWMMLDHGYDLNVFELWYFEAKFDIFREKPTEVKLSKIIKEYKE